jgi:ATP-dependent protease HslVU (ClpYQ) peptidase subunit
MTTIACDGISMAGDSLTTAGNMRVADTVKVHRTKDGRIYGGCGPSTSNAAFLKWMEEQTAPPELAEEFEALILHPDGTVYWIDHKLQPIRYLSPMAVGSGSDIAIGAMLAGMDAANAVAVAKKRDIRTGGTVTAIHLDMKEVA